MQVAKILADIKTAFEIEAKQIPHAIFFSTDRTDEVKQSLEQYGLKEREAAAIEDRKGLTCLGFRIMVSEPVPHDQIWIFNRVGARIGVFQIGEANDSARSV